MTVIAPTPTARATNERVELARYTISTGARVIYGQRVLGVMRLVDHPADEHGRRYIIERELTVMAELEAIVADYVQQALTWDAIPAAGPCCLLADLREQGSMIDRDHPDPADRGRLTEQDLAIAALVGRYIERREHDETPRVHDLLAVAAEFGDTDRRRAAHLARLLRGHARLRRGRSRPWTRPQVTSISGATPRSTSPETSSPMPEPAPERPGSLDSVSASEMSPTVAEVLRFEDLPLGSRGTRRAVVRWSDGSEGEALTWYADEVLVCEGDLIGKTREQLRSLHFRRDRDWLQS
jgi:hypothetical protein